MFRQSSYLVGLEMAASGDTFADSGLEPAKFAGVGGCFPINLKGRGFIGAIAVSGMEHIDYTTPEHFRSERDVNH